MQKHFIGGCEQVSNGWLSPKVFPEYTGGKTAKSILKIPELMIHLMSLCYFLETILGFDDFWDIGFGSYERRIRSGSLS